MTLDAIAPRVRGRLDDWTSRVGELTGVHIAPTSFCAMGAWVPRGQGSIAHPFRRYTRSIVAAMSGPFQ